jgi:hypothetical protein
MLSQTSRPLDQLLIAFGNAHDAIQKHNFNHGLDGPFQQFLANEVAFSALFGEITVPERFTSVVHQQAQEQLVTQWGLPLGRYGIEIAFQPIEDFRSDEVTNFKKNKCWDKSSMYEGSQAFLIALSVPTLLRYLEPLAQHRSELGLHLVSEVAKGIEKQLENSDVRCSNENIFRELMVSREKLGTLFYKCDIPEQRLKKISASLGKYSQ